MSFCGCRKLKGKVWLSFCGSPFFPPGTGAHKVLFMPWVSGRHEVLSLMWLCPSYYLVKDSLLDVGIFFHGFQHSLSMAVHKACCDFVVLTGEDECTFFYSLPSGSSFSIALIPLGDGEGWFDWCYECVAALRSR